MSRRLIHLLLSIIILFNVCLIYKHEWNNLTLASEPKCQPKQTIVFHKTHKCSSTTIQNILLRYAYKNSLNLALPYKGNFLGDTSGFTASSLNNTHWYQAGMVPQIFCLHNR